MNKFYNLALYSVTLLLTLVNPVWAKASKPNFIVILTDDQGYADVGFNGSKDIVTPNIDRIANEGTRFTNGYVTYSVCGPSRAGLLTGRYQGRFGFGRNPIIDPTDPLAGLPLEEQMISEVLQGVGYTSSAIGKWHMGSHPKFHPNNRGFDHFYGFLSGGHRYFPEELIYEDEAQGIAMDSHKSPSNSWYHTKLLRNNEVVETSTYLTDELSREAIEFIEQEKDNPFFLYLAYNAPHSPLQASKEYLARNTHIKDKKRRTYASMITAVDDGVGSVLAKLEQLNLDDNTLIFFLSDNGGALKSSAKNVPLRGMKGDFFEGGIRVPFAVRWPEKIPAGVDYNNPVSSLDILATFASLTNASISTERPLDGVNLMPFILGENQGLPHDVLFWRSFDSNILASRRGNAKAISSSQIGDHLYNLSNDLAERHDLSEKQSNTFDQQKVEMDLWATELQDPIFRKLTDGPIKAANKKHNEKKAKERIARSEGSEGY
ncbi:sulfatase-like hydrolase/transferase [Thalassotalea fonticola]|uniref:Sulfatase-like hydrolase/transferase n=1 Tax=Thalassotalea fonticola TaxID=3065649 RepID=A0ABZ0GJF9_9GAMM|nr:sulfatase-like hydrolase/transferase [Colwelliaceae bacterium S1-1]